MQADSSARARTRGRGADHESRRGAILAAVRAITAQHGIAAVTQAAVAATAGVSPGRVQHYFPTKDALLEATFHDLDAAARARITEQLGGDPDQVAVDEPRRLLRIVLTELIPHDEAGRAHLQFRQAFTGLALHHRAVAEQLRQRYHQLHHDDLAPLIRRDQQAGLVDATVDATAQAVALTALAEGLAYYVLIDALTPDAARDQLLRTLADLYDDR